VTSNVVSPRRKTEGDGRQLSPEQAAAAAMVAEAKARGLELTGPNGLLKLFTKNVLETALNEELTEHLGHEKNQAEEDLDGGEGAAADGLAGDDAEPGLDLIQPAGTGRGEVEMHVRVDVEPGPDVGGGVGGQVVQHPRNCRGPIGEPQ
jgi:hypothetical protein